MQIIFTPYLNEFKICGSIIEEIASAVIILIHLHSASYKEYFV